MLHVYAILDAVPDQLGTGLHAAPLRAFEAGGLSAVASEHEQAPGSGVEELWQHEQVVERLMADATVLPLRFGDGVVDAAELRALLAPRARELALLLEGVRGAVELSVRVESPPQADTRRPAGGDPGDPPTGTEFMRERGRVLAEGERVRDRIHRPLEALSRRAVLVAAPDRPGSFKAAYLVESDRVEEFSELISRLGQDGTARISCTGPWPPYSFVAGAER